MFSRSGNATFDTALTLSEGTRQAACNVAGVSQATVNTATVTFYRDAVANRLANSLDVSNFIHALKNLGVTV